MIRSIDFHFFDIAAGEVLFFSRLRRAYDFLLFSGDSDMLHYRFTVSCFFRLRWYWAAQLWRGTFLSLSFSPPPATPRLTGDYLAAATQCHFSMHVARSCPKSAFPHFPWVVFLDYHWAFYFGLHFFRVILLAIYFACRAWPRHAFTHIYLRLSCRAYRSHTAQAKCHLLVITGF